MDVLGFLFVLGHTTQCPQVNFGLCSRDHAALGLKLRPSCSQVERSLDGCHFSTLRGCYSNQSIYPKDLSVPGLGGRPGSDSVLASTEVGIGLALGPGPRGWSLLSAAGTGPYLLSF